MGRVLRASAVFVLAVFGLITIVEVWSRTWAERAALASAFGVFALVMALPKLRKEDSDRAIVLALVALSALVASAVVATYVIHSWAWLGLAGGYFLVIVAGEVWERYQESRPDSEPGIDRDIEEKQRRQFDQLSKSFPRI